MPSQSPELAPAIGLPQDALVRLLKAVASERKVQRIQLFGSRARGNFRPNSDIDLCVDAPGITHDEISRIESRVDDLLLPWQVDLLIRHQVDSTDLLASVERDGMELWSRGVTSPIRHEA